MREVRRNIEIAASLDLSVLITGEPDTGKELVARGVHNPGRRSQKIRWRQSGFRNNVDVHSAAAALPDWSPRGHRSTPRFVRCYRPGGET
jgi:Sigma-54 interaction domain